MLVDPTRMHLAGREVLMLEHIAQEGDIGADAFEAELGQGP